MRLKSSVFTLLNTLFICCGTWAVAQSNTRAFEPIRVDSDSTHIYLEKEFPLVKETGYRLGHVPQNMEARVFQAYEIILYGKPKKALDYLGVSVNFSERAIPVFRFKSEYQGAVEKSPFVYLSFDKSKKALQFQAEIPLEVMAFAHNIPLDSSLVSYSTGRVFIQIPDFLKKLNKLDLVVYAVDEQGILYKLELPMAYGMPIQ